jgi:hypothetical protein
MQEKLDAAGRLADKLAARAQEVTSMLAAEGKDDDVIF